MSQSSLAHRKPGTAAILSVRPLTEADLSHLRERAVHQPIQRIKDSHHRVARMLASGQFKDYEVAQTCGYSLAMIGLLKRDPSTIELIAHYRALTHNADMDAIDEDRERSMRIKAKADRRLEDMLDDEELPMSVQQVLAISADRHDRIGLTKKHTQTNINVDMGSRMEEAMARVKRIAAE